MLRKIVKLCKQEGITISELERRSGITPRTVRRWDINTPSVDKVKKVADYFGVSVDFLLAE